jgi:hypothetical protein
MIVNTPINLALRTVSIQSENGNSLGTEAPLKWGYRGCAPNLVILGIAFVY